MYETADFATLLMIGLACIGAARDSVQQLRDSGAPPYVARSALQSDCHQIGFQSLRENSSVTNWWRKPKVRADPRNPCEGFGKTLHLNE